VYDLKKIIDGNTVLDPFCQLQQKETRPKDCGCITVGIDVICCMVDKLWDCIQAFYCVG
jgi:hypothetical protein